MNLHFVVAVVGLCMPAEGYIRFDLHADNGRLSVIGVHEVPGPISLPNVVSPGYTYEASIDGRRIALGFVPDPGVQRSFANRGVPGWEAAHHTTSKQSFDFPVRIPESPFTVDALPRLKIVLYQVSQGSAPLTSALLPDSGVQAMEIAQLPGIRLEELKREDRATLEKILERHRANSEK